MSALLSFLSSLFSWVLTASWQASVLVAFILLIQRLLGPRLNPRWRHALWLLVILRLLLPSLPESAFSLFQFAPQPPPALATTITQPWQPLFTGEPFPSSSNVNPTVIPNYPFSYFTLLTILWIAGAFVLLILTWEVNRRFARQVAHSPGISDPGLLQLFAEAKAELRVRRHIRLIESAQVQSPAIMGLFQPTLLLPANVRDKFDPRELRFIFLHELAHLKRGDVLIQALIALLQIIHWFNPILWYAFRRLRLDREPATDALVLSRTGEAEKERYGLMLIKLLEHFNQRHSLPTLVGILEDKDQFKRRFGLIARFTRGAYGWSLLGVLLIGLLSIVCLTKSKAAQASEPAAPIPDVPVLEAQYIVLPQPSPNLPFGTISRETAARLLNDPKNKVTTLLHSPAPSGRDDLKCLTSTGADCSVTLTWKSRLPTTRDINIEYKDQEGDAGATIPLSTEEYWLQRADHSSTSCILVGFTPHPITVKNPSASAAKKSPDLNAQLLAAVQKGNAAAVQKLIDAGAEPAKIEDQGYPLAFWAEKPEILELLLRSGCDPNYRTKLGDALINIICRGSGKQSAALVAVLLAHGANPNSRAGDLGETPVMDAQDAATLDVLAKAGADVNAKTTDGMPGYIFARDKPPEYFHALLHHGLLFDLKTDGPTLLCQSSWDGNLPLMTDLLDRGVDPNLEGVWAMTNGKPDMAKPLNNAVVANQFDAAKLLVRRGAEADHAMIAALNNRRRDIVQFFWQQGVRRISSLAYAVSQGAPDSELQTLLDHGSPADPPQDDKFTPLAIAAQLGEMDAVQLLAQHGADVNKSSVLDPAYAYYQTSPLVMAAGEGQDEVVAYLLAHGARPTPGALYNAAFNSTPYRDQRSKEHFEKTVLLLLDAGALKGATPDQLGLVLAGPIGTRQGPANLTVLKMLLGAGISPKSPMPYLAENGEKPNSVIGYLRDRYQMLKNDHNLPPEDGEHGKAALDLLEAADKNDPPGTSTGALDPPDNSAQAAAPARNPALDQQLLDVIRNASTDKVGSGDADKVGQLLAQGADPNAKSGGAPALVWALNFGKDDAAVLLIQHGADINATDGKMSAVELASFIYYCPKALDSLLEKGAHLSPPGAPAGSVVDALFSAGPAAAGKMNYLHDRVWTDVDYQAWVRRQRQVIDLLAAAGVDLNGAPNGTPPLVRAIRGGHLDAARELLRLGAHLDVHDANGETPFSAAHASHPEFLPELQAAAKNAHEASDILASPAPAAPGQPTTADQTQSLASSGAIGPAQKPVVDIHLVLVEIKEKTYQQNSQALEEAVHSGNIHFFDNPMVGARVLRNMDLNLGVGQRGWFSEGTVVSYIASAEEDKKDGKAQTVLNARAVFYGINTDFTWSPNHSAISSDWSVTLPVGFDKLKVSPDIPLNDLPEPLLVPRLDIARFKDKDWDMAPGKVHGIWIGRTYSLEKFWGGLQTRGTSYDQIPKSEVPVRLAVLMSAHPMTAGSATPPPAATPAAYTPAQSPPADPPPSDGVDESYFRKALEKDHMFTADSTVKTSTLQADAQMLQAIQSGDAVALKKILEHAVDPNTFDPDRFNSNPLFWAVHFNQPGCLKLLLDHFARDDGPTHLQAQPATVLAQRSHPDLLPILQQGLKRNRAALTALLTANLHSTKINLPAFANTSLHDVTAYLLDATSQVGYLERRVCIGSMDLPPSTTFTSPAASNISLWDALQTIASANNLRFDVDDESVGSITFYPPRDEAVIHPPAPQTNSAPPLSAAPPNSTTALTTAPNTVPSASSVPSVSSVPLIPSMESSRNLSSPPGKGGIRIELKLLEIEDRVYQANKARVDAAVDQADFAYFHNLEGVSLLSTPSITTAPGTKANIDIVREFPYPTSFDPGKIEPNKTLTTQGGGSTTVTLVVPTIPHEFATKDIGVSAEITPSINPADAPGPGQIVLNGKLSVSEFSGFIPSNVSGVNMPSFTTSEALFLEQIDDHKSEGIWIPGLHVSENAAYSRDAAHTPPPATKRLLLFVSAARVP